MDRMMTHDELRDENMRIGRQQHEAAQQIFGTTRHWLSEALAREAANKRIVEQN